MIRYIKGTLEMIEEDAVVLDNHGIGYRILVSGALMDRLPGIGGEMKIYTYMNVREDAMQLFGFESMDELEMFCQLITVSGIGPKAGLSILGTLSADDIRFAVLADDAAKKLIVELKDKIAARETVDAVLEKAAERGGTQNTAPVAKASAEAVEALAALGYSAAESLKAVRQITNADELSTEELLKQALKLM